MRGPTPVSQQQLLEEVAVIRRAEAVERERIFAHEQEGVQRDGLADIQLAQRGERAKTRRVTPPTEMSALSSVLASRVAANRGDHWRPPSYSRHDYASTRSVLRWQMAMAAASAASSGLGTASSRSSTRTISPTCSLVARP